MGSHSGGNVIQQIKVNGVTGLLPGHVVVIVDGVITKRWDGSALTTVTKEADNTYRAHQNTLGIITAKQYTGDDSVSTLRYGSYLRDRVVLSDDSALSASNEFTLSMCHLFVEGAWL